MNGIIEFAFGSDDCDILTASNETHIQYLGTLKNRNPSVRTFVSKNQALKTNQGPISRLAEVFEIDISCEFSRDIIVHDHFVPIQTREFFKVESVSDDFEVVMQLFFDSELTQPIMDVDEGTNFLGSGLNNLSQCSGTDICGHKASRC